MTNRLQLIVYTLHSLGLLLDLYIIIPVHSYTLTLLHTNDVHSRFDQLNWRDGRCLKEEAEADECFGGVARRVTKVKELRDLYDNVLLLDAGDQFQGSPWFSVYKGAAASHFMNLIKYDVMALGNHEFDNGLEGLIPFLKNLTFPVVSCNIFYSSEDEETNGEETLHMADQSNAEESGSALWNRLVKPYVVLTVGTEKIGVIGYTAEDTPSLSNTGPLRFVGIVKSVRKAVEELQAQGINKIIALGHAGIQVDKSLAASVPGIDVIVGGHTNTFLYSGVAPLSEVHKPEGPYPTVITSTPLTQNSASEEEKTLVLQDYAYGKYLGFLRVTFSEQGKVQNWTGNPILMDFRVKEDERTSSELAQWRTHVQSIYSAVIGSTTEFLDGATTSCRLHECNLGNLMTDSMVDYFSYDPGAPAGVGGVSMALLNGGSVRGSIEPGNITYEDVMNVMPFGNTIDVVDLLGEDLLKVLEYSVSGYDINTKNGKFLQTSGIRVVYDITKPNGRRVLSVYCRSCPPSTFPTPRPLCPLNSPYLLLDPSRTYRIATSSFLIRGGDGYSMISELHRNVYNLGLIDLDLFVSYLKRRSPITTKIEDRIQFKQLPDNMSGSMTLDNSTTRHHNTLSAASSHIYCKNTVYYRNITFLTLCCVYLALPTFLGLLQV